MLNNKIPKINKNIPKGLRKSAYPRIYSDTMQSTQNRMRRETKVF